MRSLLVVILWFWVVLLLKGHLFYNVARVQTVLYAEGASLSLWAGLFQKRFLVFHFHLVIFWHIFSHSLGFKGLKYWHASTHEIVVLVESTAMSRLWCHWTQLEWWMLAAKKSRSSWEDTACYDNLKFFISWIWWPFETQITLCLVASSGKTQIALAGSTCCEKNNF